MKYLIHGMVIYFWIGSLLAASELRTPTLLPPQPTNCITSSFTSSGSKEWQDITLKLTNNCGKPIDLQNAAFNFLNCIPLNSYFWGEFSPLSYPDNELKLTSEVQPDGKYLAAFRLHFHVHPGANSLLPDGNSIAIKFGAETESHLGAVSAYIGMPASTGTITLNNITSKPAGVNQNHIIVHLSTSKEKVSDFQLGWSESLDIKDLAPGTYSISAESISNTTGGTYHGTVSPASIILAIDQAAKASIKYTLASDTGQISIQSPDLPRELTGYTEKPVASVSQVNTGSAMIAPLEWNTTTTVPKLQIDSRYRFASASIIYNGFQCTAFFSPETVIAKNTTEAMTHLTYQCTQIAENNIAINVSGAPSSLDTLFMTLTPTNGLPAVRKAVKLTNGNGSDEVKPKNAAIYKVSSFAVAGYQITYDPQPLVSTPDAVENVLLVQKNPS